MKTREMESRERDLNKSFGIIDDMMNYLWEQNDKKGFDYFLNKIDCPSMFNTYNRLHRKLGCEPLKEHRRLMEILNEYPIDDYPGHRD